MTPKKERHAQWDPAEYAQSAKCAVSPLEIHSWTLQDGRQCAHCKLLRPPPLDWTSLIFGSYSREQIAAAVPDIGWQALRISLLGTSQEEKFKALRVYMDNADAASRPLRETVVTNYVYALRRGGLIP